MWKVTNYRVFKKGSDESWTGCVKHMEKTHGVVNTQQLEVALAGPPVSGQTVLGDGMASYMDTWEPKMAQWDKSYRQPWEACVYPEFALSVGSESCVRELHA